MRSPTTSWPIRLSGSMTSSTSTRAFIRTSPLRTPPGSTHSARIHRSAERVERLLDDLPHALRRHREIPLQKIGVRRVRCTDDFMVRLGKRPGQGPNDIHEAFPGGLYPPVHP